MKMNKFFMGIMGALALTACTSEEVIPDQKPGGSVDKDARFMSISIRNSNSGTRAGGDQNGDLYEEGLDPENKVNDIRFYFFDEDGKPFPVSQTGSLNYIDVESSKISVGEDVNSGMPNVEKTLNAVLVLTGNEVDFSRLKSMVAVVNHSVANLTNNSSSLSLSELQAEIHDYGTRYQQPFKIPAKDETSDIPLMLMTSSVFGTSDEFAGCEVYINPSKLKTDSDEALNDPVDIYVERVLAKVRVTSKLEGQDLVSVDGQTAIRVALKDNKGNSYTTNDGDQIYADLLGWGIQTYTDKSHLFKNISGWDNWDLWNGWNQPEWFRSYWALNPNDVKYKHAKHSDAKGIIGTTLTSTENNVTTTKTYNGSFYYTQENAGDNYSNGHKTGYDPDTQLSTRTQVYIRARLVDENGNAISLAEWGGQKYTEEGVTTAMFAIVNNQIYVRKETGKTNEVINGETVETTTYDYKSIPIEMVHLVSAQEAGKADDKSENSKRYLSYLKLAKDWEDVLNNNSEYEGYSGFYDRNNNPLTETQVNEVLSGMPGAKTWRGGDTYYYTDLAHLNPSTSNVDNTEKGAYGVVRNHIYEVELNTIFGLGTPVLIPDQKDDEEIDIIPQKPSPDSYYLGARINILSWRVVKNDVSLDW